MQASGNGGLLPPPRAPGLPGSRLNLAQVGQARLPLGEGWGGGYRLLHEVCPLTATPNPSPQGDRRWRRY